MQKRVALTLTDLKPACKGISSHTAGGVVSRENPVERFVVEPLSQYYSIREVV